MSKIIDLEIIKNREKYHKCSDRYNVIPTSDVMLPFLSRGMVATQFKESNVRKEDKVGFQKHSVILMKKNDVDNPSDKGVPTVYMRNSYDGTSALVVKIGRYRFACANGMLIGTDLMDIRIKHSNGQWADQVFNFIQNYDEEIEKQEYLINRFSAKRLPYITAVKFAKEAVSLREDVSDVLDPLELLRIRRKEDMGMDLWKIFNRVQENLVNGNYQKINRREIEELGVIENIQKAKKIIDIDKLQTINSHLSLLGEKYAKKFEIA